MAAIQHLLLELVNHDHRAKTATIRVSYAARLSAVERNMTGLRFREQIQIWGADSPDPDDFLYEFATSTFGKEADGTVARSRTVSIADDILDEDGWLRPTDEIYARVWVTPLLPAADYARITRSDTSSSRHLVARRHAPACGGGVLLSARLGSSGAAVWRDTAPRPPTHPTPHAGCYARSRPHYRAHAPAPAVPRAPHFRGCQCPDAPTSTSSASNAIAIRPPNARRSALLGPPARPVCPRANSCRPKLHPSAPAPSS